MQSYAVHTGSGGPNLCMGPVPMRPNQTPSRNAVSALPSSRWYVVLQKTPSDIIVQESKSPRNSYGREDARDVFKGDKDRSSTTSMRCRYYINRTTARCPA